jgi:hypothetical protein
MDKGLFCNSLLLAGFMALTMQSAIAGSSQFIENMPRLSPDPHRAGAMGWQKPGVDRAAYTRVMIEPVTIFISPDSEYRGLKADDLKHLSDRFNMALTDALKPDIAVVDKKGSGVLYARVAITNVKLAKKQLGLLGYTPLGLIPAAAGFPPFTLKDASLEIELLDSTSGERLGILTDKAPSPGMAESSRGTRSTGRLPSMPNGSRRA